MHAVRFGGKWKKVLVDLHTYDCSITVDQGTSFASSQGCGASLFQRSSDLPQEILPMFPICQQKTRLKGNDSALSGERPANGHDNTDKGRVRRAGEKEAVSSRPCLIRNNQAFRSGRISRVCAHGHLSVSHGLSHTLRYPTTRPGRNRHGLEETASFSPLPLKTKSVP